MSESTNQSGVSPATAVAHAMKLLGSNPCLAERQAREILKVLPHDARAVVAIGWRRDNESARSTITGEGLSQPQPIVGSLIPPSAGVSVSPGHRSYKPTRKNVP
jgi:hypothetical protein